LSNLLSTHSLKQKIITLVGLKLEAFHQIVSTKKVYMANANEASKEKPLDKKEELENPAEAGRKAIEADKKINKQDKSDQQKNDEEKKDAEQWRNEG
jgi:hypothetical protein